VACQWPNFATEVIYNVPEVASGGLEVTYFAGEVTSGAWEVVSGPM
jgi:hypothetical protein